MGVFTVFSVFGAMAQVAQVAQTRKTRFPKKLLQTDINPHLYTRRPLTGKDDSSPLLRSHLNTDAFFIAMDKRVPHLECMLKLFEI